jgi:signal transduction histidine kinase
MGELTSSAARMVQIALVSSERLNRLINEILDIERIESGVLPMEMGTHSARGLIDAAVGQVQVIAEDTGVQVRVAEAEGEVYADADRVVQTLLNLLGNALKFSPPGTEVTLHAAARGALVEFSVQDRGRGIPVDKLDRVFTRFEQVDSSDAREKGGSGLGLAISRSIVERLGGRIWAENNPSGGATFRFTLPAAAEPPAEPVTTTMTDESEPAPRSDQVAAVPATPNETPLPSPSP